MIGTEFRTKIAELEQADLKCLPEQHRIKVLIVDDDRDTTDLLRIILEPNAFEVFIANTGEQGIDIVRQSAPDVIVMDLLMPGMDGHKLVQSVRQFSDIPILVLTAVSKPNIIEQALDGGADDFMVKPMSNSMLVASIRKLARRSLHSSHSIF